MHESNVALRIVGRTRIWLREITKEIITYYLTAVPRELAEGKFPAKSEANQVLRIRSGRLLASLWISQPPIYTQGMKAKAESLLSLIETELPHWSTNRSVGCGLWLSQTWNSTRFAVTTERALRGPSRRCGERHPIFVAVSISSTTQTWNSIRDTPEFAADRR